MFSTYDCSRVRLTDAKEKEILHCLRNYNKSMGSDLTEFAKNLNVTRQRVRVVARKYKVPLPFTSDFSSVYEHALKEEQDNRKSLAESIKNSDKQEKVEPRTSKKEAKGSSGGKSKQASAGGSSEKKSSSVPADATADKHKLRVVKGKGKGVSDPSVLLKDKKQLTSVKLVVDNSEVKEVVDRLPSDDSSSVESVKSGSLTPEMEEYLLRNADKPWKPLARELGVSYYAVSKFLKSKGLTPKRSRVSGKEKGIS